MKLWCGVNIIKFILKNTKGNNSDFFINYDLKTNKNNLKIFYNVKLNLLKINKQVIFLNFIKHG